MTVSSYIAAYLATLGTTDAFGIPGGVVLEFLYALNATPGITPRLCYHEQSAGFAACGYAQASGRLGVAYATKGPGFTNLITAMADAYYDSISVLFITSHSSPLLPERVRSLGDQEMDTCSMVSKITKYARRIDRLEEIEQALEEACCLALNGRKGPVFLDIHAGLLRQKIELSKRKAAARSDSSPLQCKEWAKNIRCAIRESKRPVFLVGDGINQSDTTSFFNKFLLSAYIPVLSSRYAHNVVKEDSLYFGYVGSHGIRYANFILSKADLIVALGNRLAFPPASHSFRPILEKARVIRVDIDTCELATHPSITELYPADLSELLPALVASQEPCGDHGEWIDLCNILKDELSGEDLNHVVIQIGSLLVHFPKGTNIVCDVGNNEFWVSQACAHFKFEGSAFYSKSFGALGNALGKAIGVYYATGKPVAAFIGDQGLQMNIQELQFIAQNELPVAVILINNKISGMIKDREEAAGYRYFLHTTPDSGYGQPSYRQLASGYGISYHLLCDEEEMSIRRIICNLKKPLFLEFLVDPATSLYPTLPKGHACQDMSPPLSQSQYDFLNKLT